MFQKHFNPVQAVKYYLHSAEKEVDEGSFESVEKTLGPFDIPEGIMLTSLEGVRRICKQFGFVIEMERDIIRCMTREQWIEYAGN